MKLATMSPQTKTNRMKVSVANPYLWRRAPAVAAVRASTRGYLALILSLQFRHLPLRRKKLMMGILS
jgi:hypothetical protein